MRPAKGRGTAAVAISSLIKALNEISGVLKLDREEECCRDVDALNLCALWLQGAVFNLASPKVESARVRFAIEKVEVVLSDKETGRIDRVSPVGTIVIDDIH